MTAMEKNLKTEISALRKTGSDREQDLETLTSVLQCNQDLIHVRACTRTFLHLSTVVFLCHAMFHLQTSNLPSFQDLRAALGEKEQKLKEVEKEVELWRQKDRALETVLREKEAQITFLQAALQKVTKHVWHL